MDKLALKSRDYKAWGSLNFTPQAVPSVRGFLFKDLKQCLRKEHCDVSWLIINFQSERALRGFFEITHANFSWLAFHMLGLNGLIWMMSKLDTSERFIWKCIQQMQVLLLNNSEKS